MQTTFSRLACALGMAALASGCLLASVRERNDVAPATFGAARTHAMSAAPVLPILVLRVARDELSLGEGDRASVVMILEEAQAKSHSIVHARAAFLEILAQSVEEGAADESQIAIYAAQLAWATEESIQPLHAAMVQLFDMLTPEQRKRLVTLVEAHLATWSPTWAATGPHRWLTAFPQRELPDFGGDIARTSRVWMERSAANVRAALPRLDAARRRALAASLRTGAFD